METSRTRRRETDEHDCCDDCQPPKRQRRRSGNGAAAAAAAVETQSSGEAAAETAAATTAAETVKAPEAYAPAYPFMLDPVKTDAENADEDSENSETAGAAAAAGGPQCSQHPGDFCFFCAYEKDPNAEAGSAADLYGSLTDLVHTMNRQDKELPAVVDAVAVAYEAQIRPHINDPVHGPAPVWSRQAIARHLTFSNQFKPVFDNAVTQVFHSLVAAQNKTLLDATTGFVVEEHRTALMSTLSHYIKWQKFQSAKAIGAGGAAGGGRGGTAGSSSSASFKK